MKEIEGAGLCPALPRAQGVQWSRATSTHPSGPSVRRCHVPGCPYRTAVVEFPIVVAVLCLYCALQGSCSWHMEQVWRTIKHPLCPARLAWPQSGLGCRLLCLARCRASWYRFLQLECVPQPHCGMLMLTAPPCISPAREAVLDFLTHREHTQMCSFQASPGAKVKAQAQGPQLSVGLLGRYAWVCA